MASMIEIPAGGEKIKIDNGVLLVPDNPVIPFIEGDGTGRDIWRASKRVFDAAVEKAYQGKRTIAWAEVYAGEKAFNKLGSWPGLKCMLGKKHLTNLAPGCQKRQLKHSRNTWLE
jgi:isocitrate dehydrogenase